MQYGIQHSSRSCSSSYGSAIPELGLRQRSLWSIRKHSGDQSTGTQRSRGASSSSRLNLTNLRTLAPWVDFLSCSYLPTLGGSEPDGLRLYADRRMYGLTDGERSLEWINHFGAVVFFVTIAIAA
ncbi:hypothetical protein RRG08_021797 [Elysia crispata]|uniref:Uncharacterized protein n=1 Tax=Elysia crispata TaxID=231223 RepID=A0AAE0ZZB1_9GAST|nr:hypothetical protein RRG08_021797 [Elysia crispata]